MACFADLSSEIVDYTLDHLWSDAAALRSSGLVCKRFVPTSRFHLFASIDLKSAGAIERLDAVLQRNPSLSPYVEAIIIRNAANLLSILDRLSHLRPSYLHFARLTPLDFKFLAQSASAISLFSAVQALSLYYCHCYSPADFRRFLALGPSITKLDVVYTHVGFQADTLRDAGGDHEIPSIGTFSIKTFLAMPSLVLLGENSSVHTISLQTWFSPNSHMASVFAVAEQRGPCIRKLRIQPAQFGGFVGAVMGILGADLDIKLLPYSCFTSLTHFCLDGAIITENDEQLAPSCQTRIVNVLTASASLQVITIIASVSPKLHANHSWTNLSRALENITSTLIHLNIVIDESYCQRVQGQPHPLQAIVERDLAYLKDSGILHIHDTFQDSTILWTLRDSIYSAEYNGSSLASSASIMQDPITPSVFTFARVFPPVFIDAVADFATQLPRVLADAHRRAFESAAACFVDRFADNLAVELAGPATPANAETLDGRM